MDFLRKIVNPPKKLDQPKLPLNFEYASFTTNSSTAMLSNQNREIVFQAKGEPEYALQSLAEELAKGHSLKNFEFEYDNLWKNDDPSKPKKIQEKHHFQ
jgi:hypothetical protein